MFCRDQLDRTIELTTLPQRIVSLVPSQTELLYDFGLGDRVVGITKFCVHPPTWFETKNRIGGTKTVNLAKIADLQPDLIIGNKEENEKAQIEELSKHYPVWISDVSDFASALEMLLLLGEITGTSEKAEVFALDLIEKFSKLERQISNQSPRSCAYFIWRKPFMVAGCGTFVDDMLKKAGFVNVFGNKSRYPTIDLEALQRLNPEVILLSSEPFPFAEKHIKELQTICPKAKIHLVDGELFSWYGSRMRFAPDYFIKLVGDIL